MAEQTNELDHMVRKLGERIERMTTTELAHTYLHLFGEQRLTPRCPEQARADVLEELVARSRRRGGMMPIGCCWTVEQVSRARDVCHAYITRIDCMNLAELTDEFIRVYRFEPHIGRADYLRRVLELHAIRNELIDSTKTRSDECESLRFERGAQ